MWMIYYVAICSILVLKSLGPEDLPLAPSGISLARVNLLGWPNSCPGSTTPTDGGEGVPFTLLSRGSAFLDAGFLGKPQAIFENHLSNLFIFSQLTNLSFFLYFQAIYNYDCQSIIVSKKSNWYGGGICSSIHSIHQYLKDYHLHKSNKIVNSDETNYDLRVYLLGGYHIHTLPIFMYVCCYIGWWIM